MDNLLCHSHFIFFKYVDRAYCFDTRTGERITLDMLTPDSEALKSFLKGYMLSLYEADEGAYYSERIFDELYFKTMD